MVDQIEISPAEWLVMNIIWDQQPVTASEIIKSLSEQTWTAATIRTFLHRLVKKGALKFEQHGNRYVYSSAIKRRATVKKASKSFLKAVFDGQTGPLITHFVKSSSLSADEIQQLRELLDQKESK